jgi:polar amino acid transport system substrate-binding protein
MKPFLKRILLIIVFLVAIILTGCAEKSAEQTFDSFEALEYARIGVLTGSTGEQLALQHFPKADIKSFDDTMDAVTALQAGQLEAVLIGYPTAFSITRYNPNLYLLPEAVNYEDTCIAIRKGDSEMLAAVNAVIADLKSSGELDQIIARWFKTDYSPYEEIQYDLPNEGEPLRIGVNATREPTSFLDASGNFTGLDAEIAYQIAIALDRQVEILDMNFSALIPALQSGKIDLIVTGMSATDERRLSVDFSDPYFANKQVLTVKKPAGDSGLNMTNLEDLADKRIGVYSGTVHDQFVQDNFPSAELFRYNTTTDMIVALKSDKIDAAFFDLFSARVVMNNNPDLGILSEDALDLPLGIGFNKQNPELRERFNTFLAAAKTDGTLATLEERWFINNPEEAKMPEFDFSKFSEKATLGVAVADLPYVAYMDGRYVGYDVELISRFAAAEQINLEIITMEFSALVPALASGKVDIIADGIAITEERSMQIDFSDSYSTFKTAVLTLRSNLAAYNEESAAEESQERPTIASSFIDSFYRNLIHESRYLLIFDGLKTTALIAILSCLFGTVLGAAICFMRMSKIRLLNLPARVFISILRGIPALVLLMLIFYVIFASINIKPVLVAVVAFGMNFAAYVSEMFRSSILSIDRGQHEAGIAGGFSKLQTFIYIIMPQAINRVLPVYKGEFISMVKMTSVVGYIAVQDLTKAGDIIRSRTFDAFFPLVMVALLYFLISWLLGLFLDYLSFKTDARAQREKSNISRLKRDKAERKGMVVK